MGSRCATCHGSARSDSECKQVLQLKSYLREACSWFVGKWKARQLWRALAG